MLRKRQSTLIGLAAVLALFAVGCKKKAPAPAPPPKPEVKAEAPKPPAPPEILSFTAEPTTVERGQCSTLKWNVSNATDVSIDKGVGVVQPSGSRCVYPNEATTYTLTAKGPGGSKDATARVNVNAPPPPPPPPPPPAPKETLQERVAKLEDAYFDYDKSNVRDDARGILTRDADVLKAILADFPNSTVVLEGHCDDRGSAEYNLGLGDRRSTAAKEFLVSLGVSGDRLKTISYGKERPQCTEGNESCWQKNRRAHFAAGQ